MRNKNHQFISELTIYAAIIIALNSAAPWYIWHNQWLTKALLCLFLIGRFFISRTHCTKSEQAALICCIFLYTYLFWIHSADLSTIFTTTFTKILPVLFIILFTNDEKAKFIKRFTAIFSGIGLLSLIFYLLWGIGFPLPHTTIYHNNSFYPEFTNYYLFVTMAKEYTPMIRFSGIFTEPGHLGTYTAILIYINRYNFRKWSVWVMTIMLFLSLSVAGYLLFGLGLMLLLWSTKNNFIKLVLISITCILFISIIGTHLIEKYDNSVLTKLIFSRLVIENGEMSGNNRNTYDFEVAYDNFKHTNSIIVGIGRNKFNSLPFVIAGGNCSYKNYIFQYGIIGLILIIIFGISLIIPKTSKIYWGLFIIYCVSFIQRPFALDEIQLFPFICFQQGMLLDRFKHVKNINHTRITE